jgi:hypothetical protein
MTGRHRLLPLVCLLVLAGPAGAQSGPPTGTLRSCVMVPAHSRAAEILKEVERFGSSVSTSDRANGISVGPIERNLCPNAQMRLPSMCVTVPSAPMLRSPVTSCAVIIEPGRSASGAEPCALPAPEIPCMGSSPSARSCGPKCSIVFFVNPANATGVAISTILPPPASTSAGPGSVLEICPSHSAARRGGAVAAGSSMASIS